MTGLVPEGAQIWVPALIIIIGIVGIVVPVIPGLFVVLCGVLLWAWETGTTTSWIVFGVVTLLFAAGLAGQYLLPGKRLKAEGVSTSGLVFAAICGLVGMFVVPIVGFFLGFVLGLFLLAYLPRREGALAWRRTKAALRAILTSIGIELIAAVLMALTWVIGVIAT